MITDSMIADQAQFIEKFEASLKEKIKEERQILKDAKKQLSKMLDEKASGQMTIDDAADPDRIPLNQAMKKSA